MVLLRMPTGFRVRAAALALHLCCWSTAAAALLAQQPPAPAPAAAPANDEPGATAPFGVAAGSIGAEGGALRTDDGSLEVEWAPDPERQPSPAELLSRPGDAGGADAGVLDAVVVGPSGPVVIRWYPVRVVRPAPPAGEPPARSDTPPPEPVVTIEDGNGEWRDVTPQPAPGGGKQVQVGERGRPTRVQLSQGALFRLLVGRTSISLDQTMNVFLEANEPPPWTPLRPTRAPSPAPAQPAGPGAVAGSDPTPSAPSPPALSLSPRGQQREAARLADLIGKRAVRDAVRQTRRGSARIVQWTVDGIPGGNATVGTIRGPTGAALSTKATYQAPKRMPAERVHRLGAVVQEGARQVLYELPIRLLDAGEVTVDLKCYLSVYIDRTERSKAPATQIVETRTQSALWFAKVDGSFVGRLTESREGDRSVLQVRDTRLPDLMRATFKADQQTKWDESGPGEYGTRGADTDGSARGSDLIDATGFDLRFDVAAKQWTGALPFVDWIGPMRDNASYRRQEVYRPRIGLERVPTTERWDVEQVGGLLAQLPDRSTTATVGPDEWTGTMTKEWDADGVTARFVATWTVRK
ncbi:MAG: hypothetical protein MUC36_04265 [Planctomycetes bacterium]|nr:hypothetical protein [Planctomycetota bacterium]